MERCWGKGALFNLALAALAFAIAGCGGGGGGGNAHVNEASGSTHGLILDEREGTPPPPVKDADLKTAADNCFLLRNLRPQASPAIPPNAPAPTYSEDPPTSGPHVEVPHQQADGAYLVTPKPSDYLTSMDHGRMTIQYAPDIHEKFQLELKGLYDTMHGGTLLFPNGTMSYAVVATTWTNLLGCTGWEGQKTLDAIRDFGKATWGKYGNVPEEKYPPEGPTPAEPEEPGKGE